ncbi:MAG: GIY-YIG nuclease family protein [Selenomonadaceae bacterium]|nr:GIY-YIG nuclease family protein [Selenomonadaceae bacterium]
MEVTIYKITCKLNGLGYIGATNNFERRMAQHRRSKANTYIAKAIHEHGWKNFKKEILEFCREEIADEREIYWIKELGTKHPNGYNMTIGGEHHNFWKSPEELFNQSLKFRKNTAYPCIQAELDKRMITRTAFAQMLGVHQNTATNWLNGKYEPTISTAIRVKEVLGVDMPLEELFAKATAQQSE